MSRQRSSCSSVAAKWDPHSSRIPKETVRPNPLQPAQARLLVTIAAGLAATVVVLFHTRNLNALGKLPPDFDHLWAAARAVLHRRDPYPLVGPGKEIDWPF